MRLLTPTVTDVHSLSLMLTGGNMAGKQKPKVRLKERIQVYLEPGQKTRLEAIHEKTGAPVAELIRRAVERYLQKES
jgi:hypothetical protein